MIKIYIRNKLRIFKNFKQYLKEISKRNCCENIITYPQITLLGYNDIRTCIGNTIQFNLTFDTIDLSPLGGDSAASVQDEATFILFLRSLGVEVQINGCTINILSGSSDITLLCSMSN